METIKSLLGWLEHSPMVGGVVMASMVAFLRVLYDRKETRPLRIALEVLLSGAITLAVGSGIEAMGWGNGWHLFAGGAIGMLGVEQVRALARKIIEKRAG